MAESRITFGKWQAVCLLITMISAKSILNYPRFMVEIGGGSGWMVVLFETLLTLALFAAIGDLYKKLEGKDPIDVAQLVGGTPVRFIVGLIITVFIGFFAVTSLRDYSEQMKVIAFDRSPLAFIMVFFAAGMIIGSLLGFETIVRFHSIAVPIIVVSYLVYVAMLVPYFDTNNLTPIFGDGPVKVFVSSLPKVSDYSELIFLFLMFPLLKKSESFKSVGYISIGFSFFFLISITLVYEFVLPYPMNLEGYLPAFQLGRIINYSRFFQRIEALFLTTWSFIGLMYTCTSFYFTIYSFSKTFRLKNFKPLIAAFIVIIFSLSFFPKSLIQNMNLKGNFIYFWGWVVTFGVTILLLVIARLRGKSKKRNKPAEAP